MSLEGIVGLQPAWDLPATPTVRNKANLTQRRAAESRLPTGAPPEADAASTAEAAPVAPPFSLADRVINTFIDPNLAGDPGQRLSRVQNN